MTNLPLDAVRSRIAAAVRAELNTLPVWLRTWVRMHLVVPRPITLCTDPDTAARAHFWLVTDHVGLDDSPMRIVWDEQGFGLETTLEDGVAYLACRTASFADAVGAL
jgi:hypothetical protein